MVRLRSPAPKVLQLYNGGFPERPKGADCKSVVDDFAGPNPASPTTKKASTFVGAFFVLRGYVFGPGFFALQRNLVRKFDERCLGASSQAPRRNSFPEGKPPASSFGFFVCGGGCVFRPGFFALQRNLVRSFWLWRSLLASADLPKCLT